MINGRRYKGDDVNDDVNDDGDIDYDDDESTKIESEAAMPKVLHQVSSASSSESNLFELACPINSVSEFINSVCRRVFTIKDVWGSRRNHSIFLSAVDKYVRLGRGETLTVMQLCNKIATKDMQWIREASSLVYIDTIASPSYTQVLHNFMYWVFSSFVNDLLSVCFYVTEGEGLGSELLYYRKRVWASLMKLGETQLEESFILIPEPNHTESKDREGKKDNSKAVQPKKVNLDDDFIPNNRGSSASPSKPPVPLANINYDRDSVVFKTAPFVRTVPKKKGLRHIPNRTPRSKTTTRMASGYHGEAG